MTASQIQTVAQALIVSRLLYALPAWGSFVSAAQINKIDAFLRRLKRYGYVTRDYCMADLMHSSDYELFRKSLKPGHCLHDVLPVAKIFCCFDHVDMILCSHIVLVTCTSSH